VIEALVGQAQDTWMKDYLIRESEVCRRLCVRPSMLTKWVNDGTVPRPVRSTPSRAWRSSAIDQYIAALDGGQEGPQNARLSIADLMTRFGVGRKTIIALIPQLKGFKVGAQWRFDENDVKDFEDSQKPKPVSRPAANHQRVVVSRPSGNATNWKGADHFR